MAGHLPSVKFCFKFFDAMHGLFQKNDDKHVILVQWLSPFCNITTMSRTSAGDEDYMNPPGCGSLLDQCLVADEDQQVAEEGEVEIK